VGRQGAVGRCAMGSGVSNGWIYNNPNLFGYKGVVTYLPSKEIAIVLVTTRGSGAKETVRYDQGIVNRIAGLLAPMQPPNLVFCLDPPCG
jgi:hypothetical protein